MSLGSAWRIRPRSALGFAAALGFFALGAAFPRTPVEQVAGAGVLAIALADVFLTVLYARMGSGIVGKLLGQATWFVFRIIAAPFGKGRRSAVMSLCGPAILVTLVAFWTVTLIVGAAMILHPALGTTLRASSGPTPTDFVTAVYAAASSVSVVGASVFVPETTALRIFEVFDALVGLSVVSLTLTYLMQVYAALHRRSSLALKLHLLGGETGDAAELLAGLLPEGHFEPAYTSIGELATEVTNVKEAHHLYPVLFFFRFREPYYALARIVLQTLDAVSLLKSAVGDEGAWLAESGVVTHVSHASTWFVVSLEQTFLSGGPPEPAPPDDATRELWRRRWLAARQRLRDAGVPTIADEQEGVETYVALRTAWDARVRALAAPMAYSYEDVDPAGCRQLAAGSAAKNAPIDATANDGTSCPTPVVSQ